MQKVFSTSSSSFVPFAEFTTLFFGLYATHLDDASYLWSLTLPFHLISLPLHSHLPTSLGFLSKQCMRLFMRLSFYLIRLKILLRAFGVFLWFDFILFFKTKRIPILFAKFICANDEILLLLAIWIERKCEDERERERNVEAHQWTEHTTMKCLCFVWFLFSFGRFVSYPSSLCIW